MDIETNFHKVLAYHNHSKHQPRRSAPGPGYLDWANEPDPFRRYSGAKLLQLPLLQKDPAVSHLGLYRRQVSPTGLTLPAVAALLELSLGLSAWKSYQGNSWSLRMNPSSGDLHPSECHLILPPLPGCGGGIFHYDPYQHALEQRATTDADFWEAGQEHFRCSGFLLGLSSIAWRESWKYGMRAFRYCGQDLGHVLACLAFSASLLGWRVSWLNAVSDQETAALLGFDRCNWPEQETEIPQCLLLVHGQQADEVPRDLSPHWLTASVGLSFCGEPNRLSVEHRSWPDIDEVTAATVKPRTEATTANFPATEFREELLSAPPAAAIIRQRRSALALDGRSLLEREDFFSILDKTLPRGGCAPFDLWADESRAHLLLFVHRVQGMEPGLYFLLRNQGDLEELQRECSSAFRWEMVAAAAPLPLFLLQAGDYRAEAAGASCDQDIAADGAFAAAMLARFRQPLETAPWRYRQLHWEAGMIGQVLYLEAEAHGMRATGMGCFFDDVTHRLLGLKGDAFQDIYHFTIGKAVEDPRLSTRPPYHHLQQR